jgi:hypothetical protein
MAPAPAKTVPAAEEASAATVLVSHVIKMSHETKISHEAKTKSNTLDVGGSKQGQ